MIAALERQDSVVTLADSAGKVTDIGNRLHAVTVAHGHLVGLAVVSRGLRGITHAAGRGCSAHRLNHVVNVSVGSVGSNLQRLVTVVGAAVTAIFTLQRREERCINIDYLLGIGIAGNINSTGHIIIVIGNGLNGSLVTQTGEGQLERAFIQGAVRRAGLAAIDGVINSCINRVAADDNRQSGIINLTRCGTNGHLRSNPGVNHLSGCTHIVLVIDSDSLDGRGTVSVIVYRKLTCVLYSCRTGSRIRAVGRVIDSGTVLSSNSHILMAGILTSSGSNHRSHDCRTQNIEIGRNTSGLIVV